VRDRGRHDPRLERRADVVGRVVDQHADPALEAVGDLVAAAVQVVGAQPMRCSA
jgi:hypothetical protein